MMTGAWIEARAERMVRLELAIDVLGNQLVLLHAAHDFRFERSDLAHFVIDHAPHILRAEFVQLFTGNEVLLPYPGVRFLNQLQKTRTNRRQRDKLADREFALGELAGPGVHQVQSWRAPAQRKSTAMRTARPLVT